MTTEDIIHLTEVDARSKSNTKRIDSLERTLEEFHRLATSVEIIARELGHQTEAVGEIKEKVSKLDAKVETIEKKPAKRWEAVVEKVLLVVVGAVVGLLLKLTGITA